MSDTPTAQPVAAEGPVSKKDLGRLAGCRHTWRLVLRMRWLWSVHCAYCGHHIYAWEGNMHYCGGCEACLHKECYRTFVENADRAARIRERGHNEQNAPSPPSDSSSEPITITSRSAPLGPPEETTTGDEDDATDDVPALLTSYTARRLATAAHVHGLETHTMFVPSRCAACEGLVAGKAFVCSDCDFLIHRDCLDSVAADTYRLVEAGHMDADLNRNAVITDTLQLVRNVHKRNGLHQLLNPVRMLDMYNGHRELYAAAVDSLGGGGALDGISTRELAAAANALRFATAAYGCAYKHNYMSSLISGAVMRFARRGYLEPKSENNNRAVCDILGVPREALLYGCWSAKVLEPSYCVVTDRAASTLFLVFRGSLSDADFLSDACGVVRPFYGSVGHDGIVQMAEAVMADAAMVATVTDFMAAHPTYRLVITGHSLGAALACVTAVIALRERTFGASVPHAYTFAPPPTVSLPLAGEFDAHITSFVAGDDCVCRLQLNSVDRMSAHGAAPDATAVEAGDLTEELHILGRVLLMTRPNDPSNKLVTVRRTHDILHRIFLSPTVVSNHLMDTYADSLADCIAKLKSTEHQ